MTDISNIDLPFAPPIEAVLLLPPPPSVNRTRKIDWKGQQKLEAWKDRADELVMVAGGLRKFPKMPDKFEAHILLDNSLTLDGDNACKAILDYAKRLILIKDDGPKYLRKLTVQWGDVPSGCQLTLRSVI